MLSVFLCSALLSNVLAAAPEFELASPQAAASILAPASEPECVLLAAGDLARDVERVTGQRPAIVRRLDACAAQAVVLATVAGSDERGTMFGLYAFCEEQLGVDPMHFWADRPPPKLEHSLLAGLSLQSRDAEAALVHLRSAQTSFGRIRSGQALTARGETWRHWCRGDRKMNLGRAGDLQGVGAGRTLFAPRSSSEASRRSQASTSPSGRCSFHRVISASG